VSVVLCVSQYSLRYKSSVVEQDAYLLSCLRYIELNPVRTGMVNDPGDYQWSSYRAHALGLKLKMWIPPALYWELGSSNYERQSCYRNWISESLASEVVRKIRHWLDTGLV
jgi:putative transposase